MVEISTAQAWLFLAFVLPGVVSMFVFRLLVPQIDTRLKDQVLEAIAYSLVNMVLVLPIVFPVPLDGSLAPNSLDYLRLVIGFLVVPALLPLILLKVLTKLEARNWIAKRSRTGWDAFFGKAEPEWLIVELPDGRRLGGVFGSESFASRHPDPGHLYLQDTWELDEQDGFVKSKGYGVLLRPDDYKLIFTLNGGSTVGG